MNQLKLIRRATMNDIDRIMEIFSIARAFMRTNGNTSQWINGYPQRELMIEDIKAGHCYVNETMDDRIVAVFSFIAGPDPTYATIEDGAWLSNHPYYVIHRMGSDGSCRGVARFCFDWCKQQTATLRVDTHADNHIMQQKLVENGFTRCGIIYVADGSPRIAYEYDGEGTSHQK